VTVIDNLGEGHRGAVDERASFVEGDLGDRSLLIKCLRSFRPDAVMHFASPSPVSVSMTWPGKYWRDNVANAVNLLDACVDAGVGRFVFSLTCSSTGDSLRNPCSRRATAGRD
jgi:UDP-glucose 4-epimerase